MREPIRVSVTFKKVNTMLKWLKKLVKKIRKHLSLDDELTYISFLFEVHKQIRENDLEKLRKLRGAIKKIKNQSKMEYYYDELLQLINETLDRRTPYEFT